MSLSLSGFSAYLQTALLNHLFGTPPYSQPLLMCVGLFSTLPGSDGTGGVEPPGGGYARIVFRSFTAPSGAPPSVANSGQIQWAAATAAWPNVVGAGVFESPSSANLLAFGNLVSPADGVTPVSVPVGIGDVLRIGVGNLVIGFSPAGPGGLMALRAIVA